VRHELNIPAAGPVPVTLEEGNKPRELTKQDELALRLRERDERTLRWKQVVEAGGIDKWIDLQLRAKGVYVDTDPTKIAEKEKGAFKEKKKVEAQEKKLLRRAAWQAYQQTHIVHLGVGIHWDELKDRDRFDLDNRAERAKQNGIADWKGPDELAAALALPLSRLRWFSYHREADTGTHYRRWTIPKRDGSARTISAPKRELKTAQRWALRNIFEKLPVHGAAHGFMARRSVVSNAAVHAGADVILALDIKDFFPTITWRRVKGLLRKAGVEEHNATLVSLMCTECPREIVNFRGKTLYVATGPRSLPQGAPTSPAITNAICRRLDRRMSGLARKLGFRYTRYADDLTFSWRVSEATKAPPEGKKPRAPIATMVKAIDSILVSEGFKLHPKKTRVLRKGMRQKVTGLVVNAAPDGQPAARVPRKAIRELRAAIHNLRAGKPAKQSLPELKGMAAFIHMADPVKGRKLLDALAALEKK
jgi:RNA-directed DNA polymerase